VLYIFSLFQASTFHPVPSVVLLLRTSPRVAHLQAAARVSSLSRCVLFIWCIVFQFISTWEVESTV
jgi:hypothetical protein